MRSHNATVSPLLLKTIEQAIEKTGVTREKLVQAVAELSHLYTRKRAALSNPYLEDRAFAAAYLQYFLPVNLSKIQALLDEMPMPETSQPFTVLDLGSGPGTGALAVLDWWHRQKGSAELSIVALDSAPAALSQAGQLWTHYAQITGVTSARLQTYEADIQTNGWFAKVRQSAPFDLVVLANCLNELSESIEMRTSLVASALSLLAPHGTLMLVEPALRETSRALHEVRDRLLQQNLCNVYSPCLHENNCPALVNPDDWCHEERAWEPPDGIRVIDEEVGFIKDALKFSYQLLRKDGKTIVRRGPDTFRIVSELRELKGDTRAWVCNELGRSEIGRLDRAKSETNAIWEDCQRGTIVKIEGLKRKDGAALGRIPVEGRVEIIRPI